MNYEAVFNIFLGMITVLGCVLSIIFWIVFREENAAHPIYRPVGSEADRNGSRAEPPIASWAKTEPSLGVAAQIVTHANYLENVGNAGQSLDTPVVLTPLVKRSLVSGWIRTGQGGPSALIRKQTKRQ